LIKKFVFIGDTNSINIELIAKSHQILKKKVKYILIGNIEDLNKYLKRISSNLRINEIYDPIKFQNYDKDYLNIFNINHISKIKYQNLLNQIYFSNLLSNKSKIDLVTMPINKSIFKKKIEFVGMTEHLGNLNEKKTHMLMYGDKFSIIPLTTHINLKNVNNFIKIKSLTSKLNLILNELKTKIHGFKFTKIKFLCINPHCGENNTLGHEDNIIKKCLLKFKNISGPYAADSAFNNIESGTLYISTYHDQALIPFKIINKKSVNLTIGLDYRRFSPTHGTAADIKYKNLADNTSYIECMKF
tara:strand:- start:16 stop:918 length:903 start_codon:yes stop_codon:yes gene_type:complete